jgi:hypothetical protein
MSKIYVQIVTIQKHIHQFNFPPSFYSFKHSLISTRQHKRRTSNTTLKHETFCQLNMSQTFFFFFLNFNTFTYSLVARIYLVYFTLKHVRLPKCFRVKLTNKSHTSQVPSLAVKTSTERTFCNRTIVNRSGDLCPMFCVSYSAIF